MKRFIFALVALLMLQSCGVTYYKYYEVDNIDLATSVSMIDAQWCPMKISSTRCVAAYPDSTGNIVYLMETKTKERIIEDKE